METVDGTTNEEDGAASTPALGILEWFRPGEYEHVEQVLDDLDALGVRELRTGFSWAEWHTAAGREWYSWLLPRLAERVNVLPCFAYTPPELGIEARCASPPRDPRDYGDFVEQMIMRFGDHFEWVELWNEPNNPHNWDWHLDPDWSIFCGMLRDAGKRVQEAGKGAVLAGTSPPNTNWLDLMCRRGTLDYFDAVGIQGFPGTWTFNWTSWSDAVEAARGVLRGHGHDPEVWVTAAGYSTWQHDEYRQLQEFARALEAPAERVYWFAAHDLDPALPHQEGFHEDERHYHFGMRTADGRAKLLMRIWADQGLEGVTALADIERVFQATGSTTLPSNGHAAKGEAPAAHAKERDYTLVTGGAGFVGTNLVHHLLSSGESVMVYDNLSRAGSEQNLRWLMENHTGDLHWELEDVRNPYALREAARRAGHVYHVAGQTAVTTSMDNPSEDYEVNVQGTMNLLEALRRMEDPPPLFFTSTNKVYGNLGDLELQEQKTRYEPVSEHLRRSGISEVQRLDFRSPYGCSKGAADQYILDYARTYEVPAVVFRMSCIYGVHQHGTEDQGWVAHFVKRITENEPITFYGDGKQVRDILFIEDLVRAMMLAREHIDVTGGEAFNIGGGPSNATSLVELVDLVASLHGEQPPMSYEEWRPGDQRYFVSNTDKFREATGWSPQIAKEEGIARLYGWMCDVLGQRAKQLTTV